MQTPIYQHPFGTSITESHLIALFTPLTSWEDKYRQLILLGKQLPTLPDAKKQSNIELSGCENRVWLGFTQATDQKLHFYADSEGRIVRGIISILLAQIEGKTPQQILATDLTKLFTQLALLNQLSHSRVQGLHHLIKHIQTIAHQLAGQ